MRQPRPQGTVASVTGSPSMLKDYGKTLSAADGAWGHGLRCRGGMWRGGTAAWDGVAAAQVHALVRSAPATVSRWEANEQRLIALPTSRKAKLPASEPLLKCMPHSTVGLFSLLPETRLSCSTEDAVPASWLPSLVAWVPLDCVDAQC